MMTQIHVLCDCYTNIYGQWMESTSKQVISSTTLKGIKNNLDRHFQELYGVSMTLSLNP